MFYAIFGTSKFGPQKVFTFSKHKISDLTRVRETRIYVLQHLEL